jgi:hypothetical protein
MEILTPGAVQISEKDEIPNRFGNHWESDAQSDARALLLAISFFFEEAETVVFFEES